MAKKYINWKTKGMIRDTSVSAFNPEYSFENLNLRLSTNEGNTAFSWVNEKGTSLLTINIQIGKWNSTIEHTIAGTVVGTAVIDDKLVLFTHRDSVAEGQDTIYLLKTSGTGLTGKILYRGDLNFLISNPIETIVSYESDSIQKVYWTDGINQPRMINVGADDTTTISSYNDNSFDFVPELQLNEKIYVTRNSNAGEFPSGVIKYAFTYYDKFGRESAIFYTTPQYYISPIDRGAAPDEKVNMSFNITVNNVDTNFDYLRVYSILRTSINSTPYCKRVADVDIKNILKDTYKWYERFDNFYINSSSYNTIIPYIQSQVKISNDGVYFESIDESLIHTYTTISSALAITQYLPLSDEPYIDISGNPQDLFIETIKGNADVGTYKLVLIKIEKTNANKNSIYRIYGKDYTWQNNQFDADNDETTEAFYLCVGGSSSTKKGSSILVADNNHAVNPFPKKIITKNVADTCTIIDTGVIGDTIDPTELLYKGGEDFTVQTLEQKDNTLFMGNIQLIYNNIYNIFSLYTTSNYIVERGVTTIYPTKIDNYYANNLVSYNLDKEYPTLTPCSGFKKDNYYRFGVQFQHKTGKWSEPLFIDDYLVKGRVSYHSSSSSKDYYIKWPIIECNITNVSRTESGESILLLKELIDAGYKKARPVVVLPEGLDRRIITQGIGCPTICRISYIESNNTTIMEKSSIGNQSSWFFRPYSGSSYENVLIDTYRDIVVVGPKGPSVTNTSPSTYMTYTKLPSYWKDLPVNEWGDFHTTEIQIDFDSNDEVHIDNQVHTFHSPDIEFSNYFNNRTLENAILWYVGDADFVKTFSDIELQTSSPNAAANGKGIIHKSFNTDYDRGIVSGLFYDDYIIDDDTDGHKIQPLDTEKASIKWEVYAWQQDGSLNNDINRPANMGTQTALLKKKTISNYRITSPNYKASTDTIPVVKLQGIDTFNSSDLAISKVGNLLYQGNIDTAFYSSKSLAEYFAFGDVGSTQSGNSAIRVTGSNVITKFTSPILWRTALDETNGGTKKYRKDSTTNLWDWERDSTERQIGIFYSDLLKTNSSVKMRYKSSPHIAMILEQSFTPSISQQGENPKLPIFEIVNNAFDENTVFGGKNLEALRANVWIPCGEPIDIDYTQQSLTLSCIYGDTYFQRWDCLKTYPFNRDDTNQIVEIGSFMLESYVNCDGRYDRNRGQLSNINMSPLNFNLFNPVYSQVDNFFNYKILDEQSHKDKKFPNNITWTKTKQNGADVDLWTNVTLASILELDGDKGDITKILKFNDQLLAFQEKGVSQILYNENTQITTTAGVPIEIANSNKVQGKRYLSGTIGCSNKWSICQTPSGVYFIDDNEKSIYMFNGQFNNVTTKYGFNSWIKQTMEDAGSWNPQTFNNFRSFYDSINQEVLFVTKDIALAFSEKLDCFTSFYNYENSPFFETIDGVQIWVHPNSLWKHRGGNYCNFFGTNQPYSMTLIANQEPTVDKIFTNLEFRACVEGEGTVISNKFGFYVPFSNVEVWNEYQHGHSGLWQYSGHTSSIHGGTSSHIDRMFRIWRIDIPRDNCEVNSSISTAMGEMTETELGITRMAKHPNNRIRNPWSYIQLSYYNEDEDTVKKAEIHDIMATYFS